MSGTILGLKEDCVIKQRQSEFFTLRVHVPQGDLSIEQMHALAVLARRFGHGSLHLTVRQCIEIPHVHGSSINELRQGLTNLGLEMAVCGPRVRGTTACLGNESCVHGLGNARYLAMALDRNFYGMGPLPSRFKMAVSGCTSSCVKPRENDLGFVAAVLPGLQRDLCRGCGICAKTCAKRAIRLKSGYPVIDYAKCTREGACVSGCPSGALHAAKQGWDAYAGGKIGTKPKLGSRVAQFLTSDEALDVAGRVLAVYRDQGTQKERLADLIARIGLDAFTQLIGIAPLELSQHTTEH